METLHLENLLCPLPVLKARKKLLDMQQGEQLKLIVTDKGALLDFPEFCEASGHRLISMKEYHDHIDIVLQCR